MAPRTSPTAPLDYQPASLLVRSRARRRRPRAAAIVLASCAVSGWLTLRDGGLVVRLLPDPARPVDIDLGLAFPFDDRSGTIEDIPAVFRAADGRTVRVRGYMYRAESVAGLPTLNRYQLVYDAGRHPWGIVQVQERVDATAPMNLPVYSPHELVDVVGKFRIRILRDAQDAPAKQVFELSVQSVQPCP